MQILNHKPNIIEVVSQEFNGQYFYGLELILDEIYEEKEDTSKSNKTVKIDWFGLSDHCI
jgi:hypothetical protein